MAKPGYGAGLQFVVTTPVRTPDKHDRRAIRGHARRAGAADRSTVHLGSWISSQHGLGAAATAAAAAIKELPSPRRVGGDFSGLELPSGIEPYMIQDLVKLIDLHKYGAYPYEVCMNVHVVDRGWFPYMINDICCLHSMMFCASAFAKSARPDRLNQQAYFHYGQTLQLLQARLDDLDHTAATSDSTIMVVITLAQVAELTEDYAAVANHINGLKKIISLRGGLQALDTHNNLPVKVCRSDLSYALLSGQQPCLLGKDLSWECFIADRNLIRCTHQPHGAKIDAFTKTTLNAKLQNTLKDLHAFSCLSNLAYQTTRKFSPEMYNEMMISIFYRLTSLSFKSEPLQEALRSGLLSFSSTIFLQRQFMGLRYDHLLDLYNDALSTLRTITDANLPPPLEFWLLMLANIVARKESSSDDWKRDWLDEAIFSARIVSWSQAREMLRSVAWVDFIHDLPGKHIFEQAMSRLGRTP